MNMSQSKLMLQLAKQQKISEKVPFNEQKIEDIYSTISKLQPNNLMLVQFLTLVIEKNLVKNSVKIQTLIQMYEEIKGKKLQQEHNSFMMNNRSPNVTQYSTTSNNLNNNNNGLNNTNTSSSNQPLSATQTLQKQQQKFNKKKFLKLLKDIAKLLYPGDPKAYEVTLYLKLVMPELQQNRMKVDDNLKKFLNQEVFSSLMVYQREMQILFEIYMPENYNNKLGFQWNEIRLLQKKLPIMCLLKTLFEAQICPQILSQTQLLEIVSKMLPPLNSNHKEVMFYYNETFNSYMRDHIFSQEIKLLEGDVGLTFLQFQMVLMRIASEISKQNKLQFARYFDKFMTHVNISQIIKSKKQPLKPTKLQFMVLNYLKQTEKNYTNYSVNNNSMRDTKQTFRKENLFKKQHKQLNSLIDDPNQNLGSNFSSLKTTKNITLMTEQPLKKLQQQSLLITRDDLLKIKRNLDDQLGSIPQKPVIDKQNEGFFNVNQKFTVIGQQLPKLQDKNKPMAKQNPKQKKQDPFFGYKPQLQSAQASNKPSLLLNRKKKLRINTQYPVILSQVFYPTSFSDSTLIQMKQEQQIFLQTTYIHLGERMYEEAYTNFQKAKKLVGKQRKTNLVGGQTNNNQNDKKTSQMIEFYFEVLEAQIFEAAGKDQAALVHYYNARQLSFNLSTTQTSAKAFTLIGLSSTFYHLQQYQFSLRALLKAKQIYGDSLQLESVDNAILLNNIGSCYMMLNRNQEAIKYFNFSHQILDLKVGRFDERTLVVQQNISKNKKAFIQQMPSFKTMWKTYVQKNTTLTATKTTKKVKN